MVKLVVLKEDAIQLYQEDKRWDIFATEHKEFACRIMEKLEGMTLYVDDIEYVDGTYWYLCTIIPSIEISGVYDGSVYISRCVIPVEYIDIIDSGVCHAS